MKKTLVAAVLASVAVSMSAQSALDAYQLSQTDLRGTARFMSMGGAFTALGGDLSTLGQNPAGIGVYRKSEVGFTVDINATKSNMQTPVGNFNQNKTHVYCNNFGYIGSVFTGSDVLRTFNWGASFNRVVSFDRTYSVGGGYGDNYVGPALNTSLTNYVASFSGQYSPAQLLQTSDYNPYIQSSADWLSILAYNSYLINPTSNGVYSGLWQNGSRGDMGALVRERGYIDEYDLDFGGNVLDVVYWGVGFGISDVKYTQESNYNEQIDGALISNEQANGTETGSAYYDLDNFKKVTGTGFNFKLGLIFKPINEFRVGLAVHTPTYYRLTQNFVGDTRFSFSNMDNEKNETTGFDYFDWRLRSPWRMMIGVAGVIGGRGIISADFEHNAYNNMKISAPVGEYFDYSPENQDIRKYYEASNTIRIGGEYRLTPDFSIRAGYSYVQSGVKNTLENSTEEIMTSGTNTAYTVGKDTQYITFGAGYRYQAFYIDAAYVYKTRTSTYHAFTDFEGNKAPSFDFTETNNNFVLSMGFKF